MKTANTSGSGANATDSGIGRVNTTDSRAVQPALNPTAMPVTPRGGAKDIIDSPSPETEEIAALDEERLIRDFITMMQTAERWHAAYIQMSNAKFQIVAELTETRGYCLK